VQEVDCSERMPIKKKKYKVFYTTQNLNGGLSSSGHILEFDGTKFFDPRSVGKYPCSNFHSWDYWEDWDCPKCKNEMFLCENPNETTFRCVHCDHKEF